MNGSSENLTINPLSANFTKWSNTLKQFDGNLPTNCLSVFGHFVGLAPEVLSTICNEFSDSKVPIGMSSLIKLSTDNW